MFNQEHYRIASLVNIWVYFCDSCRQKCNEFFLICFFLSQALGVLVDRSQKRKPPRRWIEEESIHQNATRGSVTTVDVEESDRDDPFFHSLDQKMETFGGRQGVVKRFNDRHSELGQVQLHTIRDSRASNSEALHSMREVQPGHGDEKIEEAERSTVTDTRSVEELLRQKLEERAAKQSLLNSLLASDNDTQIDGVFSTPPPPPKLHINHLSSTDKSSARYSGTVGQDKHRAPTTAAPSSRDESQLFHELCSSIIGPYEPLPETLDFWEAQDMLFPNSDLSYDFEYSKISEAAGSPITRERRDYNRSIDERK